VDVVSDVVTERQAQSHKDDEHNGQSQRQYEYEIVDAQQFHKAPLSLALSLLRFLHASKRLRHASFM